MTVDVSQIVARGALTIQVSRIWAEPGEPPPPPPVRVQVAGILAAGDPAFTPPEAPGIVLARWDGAKLVREVGIGLWDGAEIVRQDQ